MVRDVSINDFREIQTRLKDVDKKIMIVNKNQVTIENNSEILKRNFLSFKKNVLESVKDVVKDIDKKRSDDIEKKYDNFKRRAISDIPKQVRDEMNIVKTKEMDKMLDKTFNRIEKRLSILENFVDEKVATSKLLSKKFDDEKKKMQDFVDVRVDAEIKKVERELKDLEKHAKDQKRFENMIDSVKDDINAVARERQSQQRVVMDIINTIEELRERMDIMKKDSTMNIKLLENNMINRIDDDVSTIIGDLQDIKDRIHRLEVKTE